MSWIDRASRFYIVKICLHSFYTNPNSKWKDELCATITATVGIRMLWVLTRQPSQCSYSLHCEIFNVMWKLEMCLYYVGLYLYTNFVFEGAVIRKSSFRFPWPKTPVAVWTKNSPQSSKYTFSIRQWWCDVIRVTLCGSTSILENRVNS